ncbi:MAG: MBOAT family O-acyltransferase [Leptospirillia bacterium]
MLFSSYAFIFVFLPITLLVFFRIGGMGHHRVAVAWLVGASLFFYGWWNPAYLGLILASVLFNYALGVRLAGTDGEGNGRRATLIFGICSNLGLLGYFKYAGFFLDTVSRMTGADLSIEAILLPLGISFFTFQQITYLVDAYRGETREYNFLHYALFVTFFPQLIAGPIVHHREMMPQFARASVYRFRTREVSVGLTIFVIGLFKKVVIADGVGSHVATAFDAAASGEPLSFLTAWGGALAYTFQLYFDFSGYSDMAIGAARMFGIRLPLNFHSPYKAVNIVEFWRRWHMTLSRFLRDYLYFPLGGNRKGVPRRYVNLFVTMLLGGLWHGAGWTFAVWGGLHGIYLGINHGWHALRRKLGHDLSRSTPWGRELGRVVTFLAVVHGWVLFRAERFDAAWVQLAAMWGANGWISPAEWTALTGGAVAMLSPGEWVGLLRWLDLDRGWGLGQYLIVCLIATRFFPNTQQIMGRYRPGLESGQRHLKALFRAPWQWRPNARWATVIGVAGLLATAFVYRWNQATLPKVEFLYFQF